MYQVAMSNFESDELHASAIPAALSIVVYGLGESYQAFMPMHVLPETIDLSIRFHLSSIAGAAAGNFLLHDTATGQVFSSERIYKDRNIVASTLAMSTAILAFEHAAGQQNGRSFDTVDAVGGIGAVLISAILMKKFSAKPPSELSYLKKPPSPSGPGPV